MTIRELIAAWLSVSALFLLAACIRVLRLEIARRRAHTEPRLTLLLKSVREYPSQRSARAGS